MKAICQLCSEIYAEVSLDTLRYPITGAMFSSPDVPHGYPPPFDPTSEWQFMFCPHSRTHRPMIQDDQVLTDEGIVILPKDGSPAYLDNGVMPKVEVDRSTLIDQTVQVSDEDAEKQARANIPGPKDPSELTTPFTSDGNVKPVFPCPICGKEFDSERKMKGHQGGAHRKKK